MTQNANGPARIAVLPSRGSTNPGKEIGMNSTKHSTGAVDTPDPLMAAITAYKRGLAEFNFKAFDADDGECERIASETYEKHLDVLSSWDQPATSVESAVEALRITLTDQNGVYGCHAAVTCMIKAAYGYLKGAAL